MTVFHFRTTYTSQVFQSVFQIPQRQQKLDVFTNAFDGITLSSFSFSGSLIFVFQSTLQILTFREGSDKDHTDHLIKIYIYAKVVEYYLVPRPFPEAQFSTWFLWHNCLKSMSSKSLYSFWTRLEWIKITHFLFGKFQTIVVKDQT